MTKTRILGISAFYHDSAAAIIVDGQIIAAAQEERFTRQKHTSEFPIQAVRYCLEESGTRINELDAIVFYDKPFLKFERLLETYYSFAPRGLISFLKAIPIWLNEKLFLKKRIRDSLENIEAFDKRKVKLLFSEHHLSHCASAYYPSGFDKAAILTIDGVGEWATATIAYGKERSIEIKKELHFPHSVGLLYSSFTYFLGFRVNSGEYKLMGLAPYGHKNSIQVKHFMKLIKSELVQINLDGSIWLNQNYFRYATGLRMINAKKWEALFEFSRRKPESDIEHYHCNLALAIQLITEDIVIKMAEEAKQLTGAENLVMAGGVALNCSANGKLLRKGIFKEIFVQPAAGDAGGALGAALAAYHLYFENPISNEQDTEPMNGTYLGPEYSDKEIRSMNKHFKAVNHKYEDFEVLAKEAASILAAGKVIGWFQGRMEFGPRALGNRSILADPRNKEMQTHINRKIKHREGFRPFAPSVLAEDAKHFFEINSDSPFMVFTYSVKDSAAGPPKNINFEMGVNNRTPATQALQAVTHVDLTARVQTVQKQSNPRFWRLINEFKSLTGCSMVLNTSFNKRGEPVVCTPEDAFRCFMSTSMDYLVINNYLYIKDQQTAFQQTTSITTGNYLD